MAIPSYSTASDFFKTNKFKSKEVKDLQDKFYRNFDMMHGTKASSMVAEISRRLPFILENCLYITKLAETIYERDIISEGLTAKKAVILRAVDSVSFISRFSVDLLNYIYVKETAFTEQSKDLPISDTSSVIPANEKHININIGKFALLVSSLGIPTKDYSKILNELPEVIINSKTEEGLIGLYGNRLDPFNNALLSGFVGNPIYHIRMQIAEWQASRYKATKDLKKALELRALNLKLLLEDHPDPAIEKELIYIQSRIDKETAYMREVETDLDL